MAKYFMAPRFLGVVFIALLVLGVWAVNGVFTQKFVNFDHITLKSDTIGLQLPSRADVKVRGVIVGEVLKVQSEGDGATLDLGIKPLMITAATNLVVAQRLANETKVPSLVLGCEQSIAALKRSGVLKSVVPVAFGGRAVPHRVSMEAQLRIAGVRDRPRRDAAAG